MNSLVDIIIPTYKPDKDFLKLIKKLKKQTYKINKIIIINTEKVYFDELNLEDEISNLLEDKISLELIHIKKSDFDHGASRNLAISHSNSDYFICMTMDAIPANEFLIENLLKPMNDNIKLTYARQLAKPDADIIEKFTRNFNYPKYSIVKNKDTKKDFGIKNYFASNVCACYERKTFDELLAFDENIILNEDMLYAYKLSEAGKSIKYVADALVYHSHSYSGAMQFKRNFDIGVSQADNIDIFRNLNSSSEGISLVKKTILYLIKKRKFITIFKLIYLSFCKYLGFKLGKNYKLIPKKIVPYLSMNKEYWRIKGV